MSRNLIIFIDSFPYACLNQANFLSVFDNKVKITPGLGYSINVKAEIFGGYIPDELGYFCEWMYNKKSPLRRYQWFFSMLAPVSRIYYLDRIIHKTISKFCGQNLLNIPFKYLGFFQKEGIEPYKDNFCLPTIFSKMKNLRKICYYQFPFSVNRDKQIFLEAKKVILENKYDNIFIASGDLDNLTHRHGVGSTEHDAKIRELDSYLEELCQKFQARNQDANIFIISDHGMANVAKSVEINMETYFGSASENNYLYFIDSTMLRVWVFNNVLRKTIEKYLRNFEGGQVIERKERERFGVVSRRFGDIILLLHEGTVFNPSFYGRRLPRAMHGYHPDLESQKGMLLYKGSCDFTDETRQRAIDIYKILKKC